MIDEIVLSTIRAWAAAKTNTKDNASRLVATGFNNVTHADVWKDCAERMAVLGEAETALVELTGRENLPSVLKAHLEAREDKGCSGCWFSSHRSKNHPDCAMKIDRWFRTQDSLYSYGLALDTATTES